MKLLLKAAIQNSKHFGLALLTLLSLFFLTTTNYLEMFSLGTLANTGVDFFTLFGKQEGKRLRPQNKVSYKTLIDRWEKIEKKNPKYVSVNDAATYLAKRKETNPINWVFRKLTSDLDIEKNFSTLMGILLLVALLKALALFSSRYVTQLLSIRLTRDLRQQYFEHIQSLPLEFYQDYNVGSLSARVVGDAGQIASSLNSFLTNYLSTPFIIVSTLGMCFYLSWQLSSIIFIGLPLIVFPVIFLTKKVRKVSRQLQRNQESFTSVLLDFLSGIHTVKIYAMEGFALSKYKEQNDKMADLQTKSAKYDLLTRPILHTVTTGCLAFVAIFGLYTLHMTLAELLVFCGLLHTFYEPVKKFAEENVNIQRGVVAAERMFEVLHIRPRIQDEKDAKEITSFKNDIVFDKVSFKYKDKWVLKDLSFRVKKGETVAIVGPTGAGKTTIVQLLPRLYDIQKGSILIDGMPLKNYTQRSIRELISYVPQKPFLFYDTVQENIAFGRDFTNEQVEVAAKKAYAEEFIVKLPEKYNTLLAETGKTLSGGQQQRLAIARALVKNAPILVMDEATSSLDAVSESRIKNAIKDLHGEVTQIIIAHRLSTIEYADRIIYLEKGRMIAEGSKKELLATCPPFKKMWDTYHQIEEPAKV